MHPQTDSLVERFYQTLKSMLHKAAIKEGRDWDKMIPFLLFSCLQGILSIINWILPFFYRYCATSHAKTLHRGLQIDYLSMCYLVTV